MRYRDLYFGMSDARNEAISHNDEFVRSYVDLRGTIENILGGEKFLVLKLIRGRVSLHKSCLSGGAPIRKMACFSKGFGYHTLSTETGHRMHHTTGFVRDEIADLCVLINSAERDPGARKWPPILGLFKSVMVTLTYMRHNRTQAEIGESFGVSQPTISRAIKVITPLIAEDLADCVPTADELDAGMQYIVDGTLLPCWSWAARPELYSGKHKTTGMKVQVACTIYGQLAGSPTQSTAAATIITD